MKYKCILPFTTDTFDENGFCTFELKTVKPGEIYELGNERCIDGEIRLNGVNTESWLEITREQLKEYFEEM